MAECFGCNFGCSLIPINQMNRNSNNGSWNLGPGNKKKITVIEIVKKFLKTFGNKVKVS